MPIATVCPQCSAMFRTPVEVLRRADGSVKCGECSSVFVGLKHALLLDSPIVERVAASTVEIAPQRNRTGLVFGALVLGVAGLGLGISHLGLMRSAFSLEYVQMVAPAYKVVGVPLPLYAGVDTFVLGQSALRKDADKSIRLSFTLYNRAAVPVAWPTLRVVLVGANGQAVYDTTTSMKDLSADKSLTAVAAQSDLVLETHIPADKAKNAVTYKLEIIEREARS